MGMSMASVAFRCPDTQKWAQIKPWIEKDFKGVSGLVDNLDGEGPGYVILSPYGDMAMLLSELPERISHLTGDYAVFATCVDSDFCLMELYLGGELVDKGCIGEVYEELDEAGPAGQLDLESWKPLLLDETQAEALSDALFGEEVFAEDQLRKLTKLTGLPIFDDELMLAGEEF